MTCERFRQNGTACTNAAQIKIQRVGRVDPHYVCNVHLNRAVREIMNCNSPTTIEIWCRS